MAAAMPLCRGEPLALYCCSVPHWLEEAGGGAELLSYRPPPGCPLLELLPLSAPLPSVREARRPLIAVMCSSRASLSAPPAEGYMLSSLFSVSCRPLLLGLISLVCWDD